MDIELSVIIGVLSAIASVFLTGFLSYFFTIQQKRNDYKENAKRDLIEKLNNCINMIPYDLIIIGTPNFNYEKNAETSLRLRIDESIIKQANVLAQMTWDTIEKSSDNLNIRIIENFNDNYLKFSDAWLEVMRIRMFMRSRKSLHLLYKPLENFFTENTAIITTFAVKAKQKSFVDGIKKDLHKFMQSKVCERNNLSANKQVLHLFFTTVRELYELLISTEDKAVSKLKY